VEVGSLALGIHDTGSVIGPTPPAASGADVALLELTSEPMTVRELINRGSAFGTTASSHPLSTTERTASMTVMSGDRVSKR
jgi:hypothetical protein